MISIIFNRFVLSTGVKREIDCFCVHDFSSTHKRSHLLLLLKQALRKTAGQPDYLKLIKPHAGWKAVRLAGWKEERYEGMKEGRQTKKLTCRKEGKNAGGRQACRMADRKVGRKEAG